MANAAMSANTRRMGNSHHFLFSLRNSQNSAARERRSSSAAFSNSLFASLIDLSTTAVVFSEFTIPAEEWCAESSENRKSFDAERDGDERVNDDLVAGSLERPAAAFDHSGDDRLGSLILT